ncbi:MAG: hypothetical protein CSA54_01510 [Gammaproteobacteria bacterium]|nr:MAG: hypothetical protein CSA54_01510 [Gammaproteobacteria bacterium]
MVADFQQQGLLMRRWQLGGQLLSGANIRIDNPGRIRVLGDMRKQLPRLAILLAQVMIQYRGLKQGWLHNKLVKIAKVYANTRAFTIYMQMISIIIYKIK